MFLFFITVYFVISLPVFMLIWMVLVVAKRSSEKREQNPLEERTSSFEQSQMVLQD